MSALLGEVVGLQVPPGVCPVPVPLVAQVAGVALTAHRSLHVLA